MLSDYTVVYTQGSESLGSDCSITATTVALRVLFQFATGMSRVASGIPVALSRGTTAVLWSHCREMVTANMHLLIQ